MTRCRSAPTTLVLRSPFHPSRISRSSPLGVVTHSNPSLLHPRQVSDLDGTMIGDDAATEAFTSFWHRVAPLTGSKLVYSTGRTLDSFLSLAAEKGPIFATPDCLICAVGTKIYKPGATRRKRSPQSAPHGSPTAQRLHPVLRCSAGPASPPRTRAPGPPADHSVSNGWREDTAWSAHLDEGWDEAAAREAAYTALNKVGKEVAHFRRASEKGLPPDRTRVGVRCACVGSSSADLRN